MAKYSEREPNSENSRGPTTGQTNTDFLYVLLSAGAALLALGSALALYAGAYSTAATNAVVAALLAYLYYRFRRNRRKGPVRNLNL